MLLSFGWLTIHMALTHGTVGSSIDLRSKRTTDPHDLRDAHHNGGRLCLDWRVVRAILFRSPCCFDGYVPCFAPLGQTALQAQRMRLSSGLEPLESDELPRVTLGFLDVQLSSNTFLITTSTSLP